MTFNLRTRSSGSALAVLSAAVLFSASQAFAGGYEKPNTFSGKWGGLGGAAASSVSGAESLFFNPAGLAAGDAMVEITGDFSPTSVSFSGPLAGNTSLNSEASFVPAFGVFGSYKITPKWGVGIGTYLAGGAKAIYKGVDFTNAGAGFGAPSNSNLSDSDATVQSDLSIIEFSLGTGYEIVDGLRLGLGYRAAMIHAALSAYGDIPTSALQTITIDQISGSAWNGFKVGLQYYPKESRWGAGAQWRSAVGFSGKGRLSGQFTTTQAGTLGPAGTKYTINPVDAGASNVFPQQFELGGHFDIVPSGLRLYLQYTFTNYSVDQVLVLNGDPTITAGTTTVPLPKLTGIDQHWVNQHDARIGLDCFEVSKWVFRAGYVLSSQVTPSDRARATFTPPGFGHTFSLGAGSSFFNNSLDANLALEYGISEKDTTGDGATPAPDKTSGTAGKYTASDFAAHLGVTYRI